MFFQLLIKFGDGRGERENRTQIFFIWNELTDASRNFSPI